MAHNIFTHDKTEGIEKHWHGLNTIREKITLDTCLLNEWDLIPVVLQKKGVDSKWSILCCSDVDLEIGQPYNPDTFKPINNKAFIGLVRDSIGGTKHVVSSCGSIRNRGRVFISVKLNGMEDFNAAGRKFGAYLNFGNGHDKSSVLWVNTSNICTVCDNTFSMNLITVENKAAKPDDEIKLRLRHTKNAELKLPAMADLIDKAVGVQAEFRNAFESLGNKEIPLTDARDMFAGFLGRNVPDVKKGLSTRAFNTVGRLVELHVNGKGNAGRTQADAFSAVTDYYSHESSGGENVSRQLVSSEYGAGQTAKADFWNLLTNANDEPLIRTVVRGHDLLLNTKA